MIKQDPRFPVATASCNRGDDCSQCGAKHCDRRTTKALRKGASNG